MPVVFQGGQTDYISKMNTVASELTSTSVAATVGGTTVLDCSLGCNFYVQMGAGNTTISLSNVPSGSTHTSFRVLVYVRQDATGSRTITWPGSVVWPAGAAPTLTITASRIDIIELRTLDSGTKFFGATVALNYT